MYGERIKSLKEVRFVIDNLCYDTVLELKKTLGKDYKRKTFQIIRAIRKDKFIIKLKSTNEPVGVFGLIPVNEKAGGIFLLTCDSLHKGNLITFLKGARKQIDEWCEEYELIMDNLYKQNETIKKWLRLLGFKPSEYQDDDFQVYYRGNLKYYEA